MLCLDFDMIGSLPAHSKGRALQEPTIMLPVPIEDERSPAVDSEDAKPASHGQMTSNPTASLVLSNLKDLTQNVNILRLV